jgi:hypothetical protein
MGNEAAALVLCIRGLVLLELTLYTREFLATRLTIIT